MGGWGGMRYRADGESCEYGGEDDRYHLLLYCKKWEKERKEVWDRWWDGWKWTECCLVKKGRKECWSLEKG